MQSFEIVRKKLVRNGDAWFVAPDDYAVVTAAWPGDFIFVPGHLREVRNRVDATRTSATAALYPAEGGAWVHAGVSDLERIITALRA